MPIAPRITQKAAKTGLRGDWTWDRNQPAYEYRRTDVLGSSVTFRQDRHTGTRKVTIRVSAYTGIAGRRWDGETFDTLKEAVAWGNEHRQTAVDASAAELGDDFLERT